MARTATKRKRPSKKISLAEARKNLQGVDQTFLECMQTHWWKLIGYYHDEYGDICRSWQCIHCKAIKRNVMNGKGEYVASTSYKHPKGYKIGTIARSEVRAEAIRRAKVYATEKSMLEHAHFNNGGKKNGKQISYPIRHQQKQKASR